MKELNETPELNDSGAGKRVAGSAGSAGSAGFCCGRFSPDTRWRWLICIPAFFALFFMGGLSNTSGVVFTALVDEFNTSRGITAWASSLPASVLYLTAPLSTSLSERYGCRATTSLGAVMGVVGMVASSLCTSLPPLYFTHGIVWGCSISLCYYATFVLISKHFKAHLSLAMGIVVSGASIGTLTLSPVMQQFFTKFGLSVTFRILAALQTIVIVCGLMFCPASESKKHSQLSEKRRKLFDWTTLRNRAYIAYVASLSLMMLGYLVPYVHLVRMAEDMGTNKKTAAFLISYLAIGSSCGRLLFGRLADLQCLNRFVILQTGFLGLSVSAALVLMCNSYNWLAVYAVAFGFFEGCYITLNPVLTRDIVGASKFASGLGLSFFLMSFPRSLGPSIAGWLYDGFHSYDGAFLFMSLVIFIANCVLFLVPVLVKRKPESTSCDSLEERTECLTVVDKETVV